MDYGKDFGFEKLTDREREVLQQVLETARSCPEVTLYLLIDYLGGLLWRTHHYALHGHVKLDEEGKRQMAIAQRQIEIAVDHASRFGVPEPARDAKTGTGNLDYWKWFRWWDAWKKDLSDGDWRVFDELHTKAREGVATDEIYQHLLPKGRWNDLEEDA